MKDRFALAGLKLPTLLSALRNKKKNHIIALTKSASQGTSWQKAPSTSKQ